MEGFSKTRFSARDQQNLWEKPSEAATWQSLGGDHCQPHGVAMHRLLGRLGLVVLSVCLSFVVVVVFVICLLSCFLRCTVCWGVLA